MPGTPVASCIISYLQGIVMKGMEIRMNRSLLLILAVLISAGICGCVAPALQPGDNVHPVPEVGLSPLSTPRMLSGPFTAPEGMLTVRFLDVGLGDAILIESPSGKTMLIDAGSGLMSRDMLSELETAGIMDLDVVLATHPHEDHIGGMGAVLTRYRVGQFIDAGIPHTTSTYENLVKQIEAWKIPYRKVRAGDTITLDPGVIFRVDNPDGTLLSSDDNENVAENLNENSLVLTLTYGNITFLLMGDATAEAEQFLQKSGVSLDADILKVAHHGSSRSSGPGFLARVRPAVSIIEVGSPNPYGYPSPATLSRLQETGSAVYRTDLHGTVIIATDGRTYQVVVERGVSMPAPDRLTGAAAAAA
jgi:competence protein ComEC